MNFFLVCFFLVFLAYSFLVGLNRNFTFRIIKRKLIWWILAHWGASILALLGKFFLLTVGTLQMFEGLKVGGNFTENLKIIQNRTFSFPSPWKNYKLGLNLFIVCYLVATLIYTHLAYLHMYLGYTLEDKIREQLIKISLARYVKLPYLEAQAVKNRLRNILLLDIPLISLYFAGGNKGQNFNQIFYQGADTLVTLGLTVITLRDKVKSDKLWKGVLIVFGTVFFTLFLVTLLQWLITKKEKKFKQSSDQENQKIDNLLDNIELLKKKELSGVFLKEVGQIVKNNTKRRIKDKFLIVANGIYPNHFLPRAAGVVLFFFTLNFEATKLINDALKQLKSVLTATWDLPGVLASNHRFFDFYQMTVSWLKDKKISFRLLELIQKIELKDVCFRYPSQKKYLLKNFNKIIIAGEITELEGRNGTGKSTIILLILGLLKPQKGQIIINNRYNLQEIDLEYWRKQIAYSSNHTLLKKGSEGEKQIQELEDVITKDNYASYDNERGSKVLILDEAWNSMDKNNRGQWKRKVKKLTKDKKIITIIIEH
ncbi:ATP-binding cassette domain-containing protein [endosymbiont GvMRE of Glomus versiforme]|uniref:ATP-binding cassette domain-containing protein n=1 Tax=endosymbiont GvMRE of Glomus versiforme TaxID=2039283 RepID=UPI000ED39580|nr:ATP-binding cassette domain-containing protein [endosymbiont GvMRE of Glomus versiforme]RHZ35297.1 ABC transporter permease/ATP-binding protein [endosymbiont GvMRE of Glomus versiforme]